MSEEPEVRVEVVLDGVVVEMGLSEVGRWQEVVSGRQHLIDGWENFDSTNVEMIVVVSSVGELELDREGVARSRSHRDSRAGLTVGGFGSSGQTRSG
jgi:hypothetical protein